MQTRLGALLLTFAVFASPANAACVVKDDVFDRSMSLIVSTRHCNGLQPMNEGQMLKFLTTSQAIDVPASTGEDCGLKISSALDEMEALVKTGTADQAKQMCQAADATIHASPEMEDFFRSEGIIK